MTDIREWEKDLDKICCAGRVCLGHDKAKQFIKSLLKKERERVIEEERKKIFDALTEEAYMTDAKSMHEILEAVKNVKIDLEQLQTIKKGNYENTR